MKNLGKFITSCVLMLCAVVLTFFSDRASCYAWDALKVCAVSVVPSLFPYMVISSLIVSTKSAAVIGNILPVSRLFSLKKKASAPIILGFLCGFPVGAKATVDMYKSGEISKEEAEVLISVSNNTGPSFVVSVIGASFWKSSLFGWQLYAYQLFSALIASLTVNRLIFPFKVSKLTAGSTSLERKSSSFFNAVSDSAGSVITVCAFIVFFSVIAGFSLPLISYISPTLAGIFSSILELTKGTAFSAAVGGAEGRFLTGLCVGWSGISVFCQTASFTSPQKLSLKRTFCTKAIQGILCGAMAAFLSPCSGNTEKLHEIYSEASVLMPERIPTAIICSVLFMFIIKNIAKRHKI